MASLQSSTVNGDLTVTGSITEGGYTAYPQRVYAISFNAQSSSNFYPIVIDNSPGSDPTWHHTFSVEMPNQGGGVAYNMNSIYGEVRGQGWSDATLFYRIFQNFYTNAERSILGIWRSTQSWYGVVVYVRGGQTYYVRTTSRTVVGYSSATTQGSSVFAIKNASNTDVSGTSANISEMLNLINNPSGFYHSDVVYGSNFSGSGSSLTNLTAGNLSGTIPSAVLGNSSLYVGTTQIALNRSSASQTLTGISIDGNAATATNLTTNRTNWSTNGTITAVVGQLAWKNYGNNHTIFDASNSTSPAGGAVNNVNPDIAWSTTYPTLMGWNGVNTYGVRVDSSRYSGQADNSYNLLLTGLGTSTVNVGNTSTAVYRNENGLGAASAYAPVLHVSGGDTMWQIQGTYGGSGNGTFYFRQGLSGSWGNWLTMLSSANYNSYSPTLTGTGASGTWSINVTGTAASETLSTISGRGNTTGSQLIVATANGQAMYIGRQAGGSYAYGSAGIYTALSDNTNGSVNYFFQGYVGSSSNSVFGTSTYSVRADGLISTTLNSASSIANSSFNVAKTILGGLHFNNGSGTVGGNSYEAAITFQGGTANEAQAGIYVSNNSGEGTHMAFATTDSYATGPQIGLRIMNTGYSYFPRSYVEAAGSFRAPIFYDSNDTNYYLNPASASLLNVLNLNGNIDVNGIYSRSDLLTLNSSSNGWINTIVRNSGSPYFTNPIDGGTFLASDVSENNNWLFQENVRGWGLFYFNKGSQSGQTFGGYTTIGAETFVIGKNAGITMPSAWTGYNSSSKVAIMLSNYSGYIWANGTIFSATDIRAPLFYDSNDTNYYCDPNSISVLAALRAPSIGSSYTNHFQIREANGGNGITTDSYAPSIGFHWGGIVASNITLESSGRISIRNNPGTAYENFIANIVYGSSSVQTPIVYDSNNTNYYCDPASTSIFNSMYVGGTISDSGTGNGIIRLYGNLHIDAYNGNDIYCNYYSGRRFRTFKGVGTGQEIFRTDTDGVVYAYQDFRSPIIYDYNDTGYYLDPSSTSNLNTTVVSTFKIGNYSKKVIVFSQPTANFGNYKQYLRLWPASGGGTNLFTLKVSIRGTWNYTPVYGTLEAVYSLYLPADGTIAGTRDFRIVQMAGPAGDNLRIGDAVIENGYVSIPVWAANTNTIEATVEQWNGSAILGTTTSAVSETLPSITLTNIKAGLEIQGSLYSSGDYEIRNTEPTITFRDTNHRTGFIHVNSNIFYILSGATDVARGNWGVVANSRWPLQIDLSNNNATFGGDVNAISSSAQIFYDSDNTNYYLNPASTSNLAVIKADSGTNYPHSFTNTDAGNTHWTNRNDRLLTSNGTNWASDGRDPIMALVTSGNSNATTIANSIGLTLHNESQTNNTFSPAITFSNRSNSGNYNSVYAAIIGKKTGQGVDSNWSAGELHFYTMPVGAYENDVPSLLINSAGNVGIGVTSPAAKLDIGSTQADGIIMRYDASTNYQAWIRPYWNSGTDTRIDFAINRSSGVTPAVIMSVGYGSNVGIGTTSPATLLQINTGTPTSATGGLQFGDDTGTRIYRGTTNQIRTSGNLSSGGYLQTLTNEIYPNGWAGTLNIFCGNSAQNAWISGIELSPGGNVRIPGGIVNSGLTAQWSVSGGGTATFNGSSILWSQRVIAIPVEKTEFSAQGYIDINCPTSGTVTYYNSSDVTTTVTCTANGIPLGAWEALYYEVTPGQANTSDQTKFRVVAYPNSVWRPSSNWLLLATRNSDAEVVRWIPGQANIKSGGSYDFSRATEYFYADNYYLNGATSTFIRSNGVFNFLTNAGGAQTGKFANLQVSSSYSGTLPTDGILFGTDTNLYRNSADVLKTDDSLIINSKCAVATSISATYTVDINGSLHYTSASASSDARFKKNIEPINDALNKLNNVRGVKFEWNEFVNARRNGYELNKPTLGVIAQELEAVFPELVDHWHLSDDCPDARAVNYEKIIPVLIEAVKELNNKNIQLEARLSALESKLQ